MPVTGVHGLVGTRVGQGQVPWWRERKDIEAEGGLVARGSVS